MPAKKKAIRVKVIHTKDKTVPLGHPTCSWEPVVTLTFKRKRPAKKK